MPEILPKNVSILPKIVTISHGVAATKICSTTAEDRLTPVVIYGGGVYANVKSQRSERKIVVGNE